MRLSFFLPALALLAAASSPAQTFVFKGERWEINDPFKMDSSIPPKPIVDTKKGTINVIKGEIVRVSNSGGIEVTLTRKLSEVTEVIWPMPSRLTDAQANVSRGEPAKALDNVEAVLKFFEPIKNVPGSWWARASIVKLDALDRLENDAATESFLTAFEKEEAAKPEAVVEAPLVAPTTNDENAWGTYLQEVVKRNLDGVTGQPYLYFLPAEETPDFQGYYDRLLEQASPFLTRRPDDPRPRSSPQFHLGQRVDTLAPLPEGGFEAGTDQGVVLRAKAVFVAAGAGAFVPRTLSLPGLTQAANVHHHLPTAEGPAPWAGQHLVVSGGGEEAVLAILGMLTAPADRRPARITLLHRRDVFQAEPEHEAALREHIAQGRVQLTLGVPDDTVLSADASHVQALRVLGADGQHQTLTLDHLLIRQGLSPKLGPLVDWGLALERKQVAVSPATFESSVPGVYAVGDINTYAGKKRLLL